MRPLRNLRGIAVQTPEGVQGAGRVAERTVDPPEVVEQHRLDRVGVRGREARAPGDRTCELVERRASRHRPPSSASLVRKIRLGTVALADLGTPA